MNTQVKRTTLELTVSPGYVREWGLWEALRELIQNALDAEDLGAHLDIHFKQLKSGPTLEIETRGITMDRKNLLLGETTKHDSANQRGKFGEGFKLAWLVLLRLGHGVKCKSGDEIWEPEFGRSDAFGADLLKVQVRPATYFNGVKQTITGISEDEWEKIKPRLRKFAKGQTALSLNSGVTLLKDPEHKGMIFCRGIYVETKPDAVYGYDMPNLQLDRDRKRSDEWALNSAITQAWGTYIEQCQTVEELWTVLSDANCFEAQCIARESWRKSPLTGLLVKKFREQYGEDIVPVTNMAESMEADHYGIKTKVMPEFLCKLLTLETGTAKEAMKSRNKQPKHGVSFSELTPEEQANLQWALAMLALTYPDFNQDRVQVACFYDEKILGLHTGVDQPIYLARTILDDAPELLATLIHEVSHDSGNDGEVQHERQIEKLLAQLAFRLSGGE